MVQRIFVRGYYSLRGHTEVPLRTLNLLVVDEIGFGLINRDDGVFFALIRTIVTKAVSHVSILHYCSSPPGLVFARSFPEQAPFSYY